MKVKRYVGSVPSNVSKTMGSFAGGVLASIDRISAELALDEGRCHLNVENWVSENGGKIIRGWLLVRKNSFLSSGIWVWVFHSVWMDKKGNLIDITYHGENHDCEKSIVWLDIYRKPDLVKGLSYNNLMVIDNSAIAKRYSESVEIEIKAGDLYWATPDMMYFKPVKYHTGVYRLLGAAYAENEKIFEQVSGLKINGTILTGAENLHRELMLDFSLK